jgi:AcrR family transcriptional regulator
MPIPFVKEEFMRADAERNRARVLEAAAAAFAEEGIAIPVAEIARRAGVGTGTVTRHFPTKEALYEAIVLLRVEELVEHAHFLATEKDPATAFFDFLAFTVELGAASRGVAQALAGGGFDIEAASSRTGWNLAEAEQSLLARAQQSGAVRSDVTFTDVKALIAGCLSREQQGTDPAARRRLIAIVSTGLRPPD